MSTQLILYGMDLSPPVRACLLTLKALDLPHQYKIVDLFAGEHMTEEFQKKNPQHTLPVLEDQGIWIWDSHAICGYLVDKYGKSDELYPKDFYKRAVVNQRLHFDSSILFPALRNISMPYFREKVTVVPKEKTKNVIEGYQLLEAFLADGRAYLAGEHLTIADFCCVITLTSLDGIIPMNAGEYPSIEAWVKRLKGLPYYESVNKKGHEEYINLLKPNFTEIEM